VEEGGLGSGSMGSRGSDGSSGGCLLIPCSDWQAGVLSGVGTTSCGVWRSRGGLRELMCTLRCAVRRTEQYRTS